MEVELDFGTPNSLGLRDVVLDPIQVMDIQHHSFMPNLDVVPLTRNGFEDMVGDAFNVEELTNMSTKPSLGIEFKGGLNSFSLKEN